MSSDTQLPNENKSRQLRKEGCSIHSQDDQSQDDQAESTSLSQLRPRSHEARVRTRLISVALATFVVIFFASLFVAHQFELIQQHLQETDATYLAQTQASKLQMILNEYEQITSLWKADIIANDGEVRNFEDVSQQLLNRDPTIMAIELAPDGVIEYVYPKNNDIMNYDILADPDDGPDAMEARDTGEPVLSGPINLKQGGSGVIIRSPIYIDEAFWGFSIIVLEVPDVFLDAGFDTLETQGYLYQLWYTNGEGEKIQIDGQTADLTDPVGATVIAGQRTWTLSLAPKQGWYTSQAHIENIAICVLVAALAAWAAWLFTRLILRKRELETTRTNLMTQSEALSFSEKANRMQARALEAAQRANDMQAEALKASREANDAQALALENSRRKNREQARSLAESREANRAKSEFLSRISHDIRTPIGAIQNLIQFAKEDMNDKEKLLRDIERIETSNRFLLSLINDVLDISRVDSGRIELSPVPYHFDEYMTNIRNLLEPMCEERGLACEVVNEGSSTGVIVADKVRLNQIALSLLSNAVQYTPTGGVVRYVLMPEDLLENKVDFAFVIEDTGIGMSEEFQRHMFEDFTQEYDNPSRPQGLTGTGLGLSLVRKMLDLMDGTIQVTSKLGCGTRVEVHIPFPDATRDPLYKGLLESDEPTDIKSVHFEGKILVVEDNVINLEIALRIFSEFGLEAESVGNGQEALQRFTASDIGEFKAILMDIQMPVMNGYDATRAIRSLDRPDAKSVPILAMTADAFGDARDKARAAGMNEFITKPLAPIYIAKVFRKIDL